MSALYFPGRGLLTADAILRQYVTAGLEPSSEINDRAVVSGVRRMANPRKFTSSTPAV